MADAHNTLTVSISRHILASIISNHDIRRELLYDIVHQELLNDDLEVKSRKINTPPTE